MSFKHVKLTVTGKVTSKVKVNVSIGDLIKELLKKNTACRAEVTTDLLNSFLKEPTDPLNSERAESLIALMERCSSVLRSHLEGKK